MFENRGILLEESFFINFKAIDKQRCCFSQNKTHYAVTRNLKLQPMISLQGMA
jgi:hypothetical protein